MFDLEMDIALPYIIFALAVIIILYMLTKKPSFAPPPPPQLITGNFSLEQLKDFDGVKRPEVFLAAKGTIYDVTNTNFYKKDGPYGLFAAHDASVNLAKMSHDETLLNQWGTYTLDED
jgi:membrane-associated progesterone receptor component